VELDIYLRVSRIGDEKQRSIEGQEVDARARVADVGAEVGMVHADLGRSAWNPRVRRAGWDYLMARLESGATDGVVVFDLERFSRQPIEGERLLSAASGGLRVLDSDSEYDLASPSGRKAFRDQMASAAYYSDRLSSRVKRGKRIKAANGAVDRRRSFGFEADGVTVNEAEAAIIRESARRLLAGETQDSIMRDLTARGIVTTRGLEWQYATFRQVMTRPRNAGLIKHNGVVLDGVRLPGKPILDAEVYHQVMALYAARRPGRPPSGRYMLTGFADCGLCGAGLTGRPTYGAAGKQYWCQKCHRIYVYAEHLDEWAGDWAIRELSDPASAEARARVEREMSAKRAGIEREIAGCEETAALMADRLGRGEMPLARYDAFVKPLDARIAVLRAELDGLVVEDLSVSPVLTPREVEALTLLEQWQDGSAVERRALVKRALRGRRIVVGPGRGGRFDAGRCAIV
jgi:DNA invertase Pin-like site-specific DNA recombinase